MITCRSCGRPQSKPLCNRCKRQRYGRAHQVERRFWEPIVATGTVTCTRCGVLIPADTPAEEWDLDHRPGRSRPAHASCNREAGARSLP